MATGKLITSNKNGIYCPPGDFYIDPWGKVKIALITHAHSDHLRQGSQLYICSKKSHQLVRHRLKDSNTRYEIKSFDYEENFELNGVSISFYPAGHILGSSQIRIEYKKEVAVLTGDYKLQRDPTCESFIQLKADIFVTEATFGLPIYKWEPSDRIIDQMYQWIIRNKEEGMTTAIFGYSMGKAQRLLAELKKRTDEVIYIHGALDLINDIYKKQGVKLPTTELVVDQEKNFDFSGKIVISPPSSFKSKFMKRFRNHSSAFSSGWVRVRGRRRMAGYDTGFVLSDHVDFPGLVNTVKNTGANQIFVGFSQSPVFVRYLKEELGLDSFQLNVKYSGEDT